MTWRGALLLLFVVCIVDGYETRAMRQKRRRGGGGGGEEESSSRRRSSSRFSTWKGPAPLSAWRNVDGARMRSGWLFDGLGGADRNGTIFVSLVSYRDPLCPRTLLELFSKARTPRKVFVGLVQQNEDGDVDCFR